MAASKVPERLAHEAPKWWKSTQADIEEAVSSVKLGEVSAIATSPGGRKVYLVAYGKKPDLGARIANYNSAVGAREPWRFADKRRDVPPIVFILGPVHGQEVENIVGTLNLIRVMETGKDVRGKEWPVLRDVGSKARLLVIPLANPDGRMRSPDCFVGQEQKHMEFYGQGTRKDGSHYGWPGTKAVHPMKGDVDYLGAYFNDAGINIMHDEFFAPMAEETKAIFKVAIEEAPDVTVSLHSHGQPPEVCRPGYLPVWAKKRVEEFSLSLEKSYKEAGLPCGNVATVRADGEAYPHPPFNLTSALHHVSGTVSFTFECSHGLVEEKYAQVDEDNILDIELLLFEEMLKSALKMRPTVETKG